MGQSRTASIAPVYGHLAEARLSGSFKLRLAIASLAGLAAASVAAQAPVETFAAALLSGSSLVLSGLAALTTGALRRRRAARVSHRSQLSSGPIAKSQGVAFLLWFAGHAAVWAGALALGTAVALRVFGPRALVLIGISGCAAAAALSLAGLAGSAPLPMLGLCWERRGPAPPSSPFSLAEIAVVLRSRFADACERDAAAAKKTGRMSTFSRLQIALDLARTSRSGPRVELPGTIRDAALDETSCRALALIVAASPAMLLTFLLALLGLLALPRAYDPANWPSIASLSGMADPTAAKDGESARPAADEAEDSRGEASAEHPRDPFPRDQPSGQEESDAEGERGSQGEKGSQSGSDGQAASSDQAAAPEAVSRETGRPEAGGEGRSRPDPNGSRSGKGAGESGEGESRAGTGRDDTSEAGGMPDDPRGGDSGAVGSSAAGERAEDSPSAGVVQAENGSGEPGGAEGQAPAPGDGSSGDADGGQEAAAEASGAGSGPGDSEADAAWGSGDGSPVGEPSSMAPPAASDVVTLVLPVLGSETVRLEDEEAPTDEAGEAPRGPVGRRRPGEAPGERAEPAPSPPQQPLPAWIVRLLRGKG